MHNFEGQPAPNLRDKSELRAAREYGLRLLRVRAVADKCDVGISTVWAWLKTDPTFPHPIKLGPRTTAWRESDLDAWIEARAAQGGEEVE